MSEWRGDRGGHGTEVLSIAPFWIASLPSFPHPHDYFQVSTNLGSEFQAKLPVNERPGLVSKTSEPKEPSLGIQNLWILFYFYFSVPPAAYGSSWARD